MDDNETLCRIKKIMVKTCSKLEFELINASKNGDLEVVKFLIHPPPEGAGVNINAKDENGCTPLMTASVNGHIEIVKFLLNSRIEGVECADIDARDEDEETALMYATSFVRLGIIKLLLTEGADSDAKNNDGDTFLDYIDDPRLREELREFAHRIRYRNIKGAER